MFLVFDGDQFVLTFSQMIASHRIASVFISFQFILCRKGQKFSKEPN